jgi:hypothetical protein
VSEGDLDPRTGRGDLHVLPVLLVYLSGQGVVGVGEVDIRRAHLIEMPAVAGDGEVDDVEDLEAAEAGDLHGSHGR